MSETEESIKSIKKAKVKRLVAYVGAAILALYLGLYALFTWVLGLNKIEMDVTRVLILVIVYPMLTLIIGFLAAMKIKFTQLGKVQKTPELEKK